MTICEERRGRVDEQRLAAIPLIAIAALDRHVPHVDWFGGGHSGAVDGEQRDCDDGSYEEVELREGYIVVDEKGSIEYKDRLSEEEWSLVRSGKWRQEPLGKVMCTVKNDAHYWPLKLYSIGNGPAVNVSVWLERDGESPLFESAALHLPTMQVREGEYRYVGILFKDVQARGVAGNYSLVIRYSDVMGNLYRQKHNLGFRPSVQDGKPCIQPFFNQKIKRILLSRANRSDELVCEDADNG